MLYITVTNKVGAFIHTYIYTYIHTYTHQYNVIDKSEQTALHYAIYNSHEQGCCKHTYIHEHTRTQQTNKQTNRQTNKPNKHTNKNSPNNNKINSSIFALLKYGAKVNTKNCSENTLLHVAVYHNQLQCIYIHI